MKQSAIKTYFQVVAQLLVSLTLLVVVIVALVLEYTKLLLMRCMVCLDTPLSLLKIALLRIDSAEDKTVDSCECYKDREHAIQQVLSLWDKKSYYVIAKDRRTFEATEWGQQAIRNSLDRHLYVVLIPTRQENLARIGNVLREMDDAAFRKVLQNVRKKQQLLKRTIG